MLYDLLAMDLKGWHPRQDVPQTKALLDQKMQSFSPYEEFWHNCLHDGVRPGGNQLEFSNPTQVYNHLTQSSPKSRVTQQGLGRFLNSVGCEQVRTGSGKEGTQKRAWKFPTLAEARKAWDRRMKTTTDWGDLDAHWSDADIPL